MVKIRKSFAEDDSSSFGRLPDEIVLQVLTNLVDLKILCFCKLVCRRFYWIVVDVDTISLTPSLKDNSEATFPKKLLKLMISGFKFPFHLFSSVVAPASEPLNVAPSSDHKTFRSAIQSLERFKKLKSLCMVLPASFNSVNDGLLFKWKLRFHDRVDSFMFLSPDSVCETNGTHGLGNGPEDGGGEEEEEEYMHISTYKIDIALRCLKDAIIRYRMLLGCTSEFPLLENVSIADNGKRGRITLNNEKVDDLPKQIRSSPETIEQKLKSIMEMRYNVSECYVPLLKLPVSGYVMEGVTLVLVEMNGPSDDNDNLMKNDIDDDSEDKEEAAYIEAMTAILKKYRGQMDTLMWNSPI